MRRVVVLAEVADDLEAARRFYDSQQAGIGEYCTTSLLADIESLALYHGIHRQQHGCYRNAGEPISIWHLLSRGGKRDASGGCIGPSAESQLDSEARNPPWKLRILRRVYSCGSIGLRNLNFLARARQAARGFIPAVQLGSESAATGAGNPILPRSCDREVAGRLRS